MKFKQFSISQLIVMVTLATSGTAFASGTHAGGHGDGGETVIGKPGVAAKASRTITIEMSDNMRYTPSSIQVKQGETVRFIVKNVGQVKHELSLGTEKELLEHLERLCCTSRKADEITPAPDAAMPWHPRAPCSGAPVA